MAITEDLLVNATHRHPRWIRSENLRGEELDIYEALKRGDKVEKGSRLQAKIQSRRFRPRIHWREEFMSIATAEEIAAVEAKKQDEFEIEYLVLK